MENWTANNPAQVDTWFSLFRLGQIRKQFNAAGNMKMSELTFFNPTASKESLKMEATLIADTMDRLISGLGARLENNISRHKALSDMITLLIDKDKTIMDLATKNDANYFFINEKTSEDED